MMYRAHVIRLYPSNRQATYFVKAAGVARFSYNWALTWWMEEYEKYREGERDKPPSGYEATKELAHVKKTNFTWMKEVTKYVPESSVQDVDFSYSQFLRGNAEYPKFKKVKKTIQKFQYRYGKGENTVYGSTIRIPRLGWVRMAEPLRYDGRIVQVVISKRAGNWYASVSVEIEDARPAPSKKTVLGVDLGVQEYVTSDGERYEVPRAYRKAQKRLRRAQQNLSRKQKGSANREKAKLRVQKLHKKVSDVRKDWLHKLTTSLAENPVVAIEDLNVSGMLKNRHLAKSVSDAGFYEFRKQLEYKMDSRGTLVLVDRWFPSSKTCSECGTKTKFLPLSIRSWTCVCGITHDRDLNAAINLKNYAVGYTVSACGEFLTLTYSNDIVRLSEITSMKQELGLDTVNPKYQGVILSSVRRKKCQSTG